MNKAELKGKGYALLLRTSTDDQDLSIEDQRKFNNAVFGDLGMRHCLDKVAEGVSASKTLNRWDLDDLVTAKKNGADFEYVGVYDYSRLTRGGIQHANEVKQRLAQVGLKVLSATEELPEGDEAELLESFYHYKNRLYSKNLSRAVTRAKKTCLLEARHPSSSTTPFGFDRMYITADGTPTLIVRNLGGRRKVKLDPVTHEVRGYIEPDENGKCVKFAKQNDEQSVLVPSEQPRVDLMNRIFKEFWKDGVSLNRITNYINLETSLKPYVANRWSEHVVHRMLHNPVYLGEPVALRTSKGWFFKIGSTDERPMPVSFNAAKLEAEKVKNIPLSKRPKNEWFAVPAHKHYLHPVLIHDPEVCRLAREGIRKFWNRWDANRTKYANRDRHKGSKYFLKMLLHSKQGNYPMVGRTTSQKKKRIHRYYRINESECFTKKGSLIRKSIPAEPLERAVLGVVKETLGACDDLGSLVESHVSRLSAANVDGAQDRLTLENEDKTLARRIRLFYETAGDGGEDDGELRETVSKMKARRAEVQNRLSFLNASGSTSPVDPAMIRDHVLSQFGNVLQQLDGISMHHFRRLVNMLCTNMSVDLETRQLDFEVRLPSWAMSNATSIATTVGLVSQQDPQMWYAAHNLPDLKIAQIRCEHRRKNMKAPICYQCRRIKSEDIALKPAA